MQGTIDTPGALKENAADEIGRDAVVITGLAKRFGQTTVLHDVGLTIAPGEIHALVGQNGSGKSTLIKILSGVHTADDGEISVGGTALSTPVRPSDLRQHGLAFVHQDLGLVDDLTVVENVRVGQYETSRVTRKISWELERARAEAAFARLNATISLDAKVGTLQAGQRAVVAIARALQGVQPGTGLIIFDESTQSLPRETLPEFYEIVRAIARTGTGILIVSHRLDEVMGLADRVTVLRDGGVAASGVAVSDLTEAGLSQLILGRELASGRIGAEIDHDNVRREIAFEAIGVKGLVMRGLDLQMHGGEVVGITGGGDCGLEEITAIFTGRSKGSSGQLVVGDRSFDLPVRKPQTLQDAGLAVIPENRLADGLAAEVSAISNISLPRVTGRGRFYLRRRWQQDEFAEAVKVFGATPALPNAAAASFSGGNQQKLLLSKWFLDSPRVLIACEPTQAVDVGARLDILRALRSAANTGTAVVVSSIEVQDLAVLCDRVIVLRADGDSVELTQPVSAEQIAQVTYSNQPVAPPSPTREAMP